MIEVHQTVPEDVDALAPRLRQADIDEIRAASGLDPQTALILSRQVSSMCFTVFGEGRQIAMFGVRPEENPSIGRIWMLGSDEIHDHRFGFLRRSKSWVDFLQDRYPILYNYIDARNSVHIRWLHWLGFSFINEEHSYGFEQRLFYQFVRINHV